MENNQDITNRVLQIIKKVSGKKDITTSTLFNELELDSIDYYELSTKLQNEIGLNLDLINLSKCKTINDIIQQISHIKPRCKAEEVIIYLYKNISETDNVTILSNISEYYEQLFPLIEQIFSVRISKKILKNNPYLLTITNYLAAKISPAELDRMATKFLELAKDEN